MRVHLENLKHRVGDLISYQNDGKGCAAIAGDAEKA